MIKCISNYNISCEKSHFNVSFSAKRISNKVAQEFWHTLLGAENPAIVCHENTDHDALNSARAVARLARGHGKKVSILADKKNVQQLSLPSDSFDLARDIDRPDLLLLVDHNGTDRMPKDALKLLEYDPQLMIMDHHRPTRHTLKNALTYIDTTARSCCGIVYRWMRSLQEPIDPRIARKLTLGVASDMKQSELIRFDRSRMVGMPALAREPESREVLVDLTMRTQKDMDEIGRHLDVLSNLTPAERELQLRLFKEVRTTPDNNLAFVVIKPNDEQWLALGCKTERTSEILRDLRAKLIRGIAANDNAFTPAQKKELAAIKSAAIFYPVDDGEIYRVSVHGAQALDVLQGAKSIYKDITGKEIIGDGHPNRAGGRINTCSPEEVGYFIQSIKQAATMAS